VTLKLGFIKVGERVKIAAPEPGGMAVSPVACGGTLRRMPSTPRSSRRPYFSSCEISITPRLAMSSRPHSRRRVTVPTGYNKKI
jgi:hypothetical protein